MGLLRKAVEISCIGQNEVMKAVSPDMSELEIQGLHEYVHKKYGAERVGYGSIIGSGENGCTLHYEENTKRRIGSSLLLMDVGAEYHGYSADVTRTVPANGKFSEEEKVIYQLVYDAQEAAFKLLKDGAKWGDAGVAASNVIAEGLIKLESSVTKKMCANIILMVSPTISVLTCTTAVHPIHLKKIWSLRSSRESIFLREVIVIKNGGALLCG